MRLPTLLLRLAFTGAVVATDSRNNNPVTKYGTAALNSAVRTGADTCADPTAHDITLSLRKRQGTIINSGLLSIGKGVQMTNMAFGSTIQGTPALDENWNFAKIEFNKGIAILGSSTCLSNADAFSTQSSVLELLKPGFDSFFATLSDAQDTLIKTNQTQKVLNILKRVNQFTEDAIQVLGGKLPKDVVASSRSSIQSTFDNLQATIAVWEGYTKPQDGIATILIVVQEATQEIDTLASAIQDYIPGPGAQILADRERSIRDKFAYTTSQIKNAAPIAPASANQILSQIQNTQRVVDRVITAINNKRYSLLQSNQARTIERLVRLLKDSLGTVAIEVAAKLPSDARKQHEKSYESIYRPIDEFLYTWSGSVYEKPTTTSTTTVTIPVCSGWLTWGCRSGRPPKRA